MEGLIFKILLPYMAVMLLKCMIKYKLKVIKIYGNERGRVWITILIVLLGKEL